MNTNDKVKHSWDQILLQKHIDEQIEESLTLDYKSADAIGRSDGKKKEITKDVSAMANSSGGTIIYGVKEYDSLDKQHIPEKIDTLDRTQFSKEWLEHVINNIRPRISSVIIHPVDVDTDPNAVVYVVEIPQSTTAHQATDYRYYKRFNFESVPMEDYEIRDVMNRGVMPDVSVEFKYRTLRLDMEKHEYALEIWVKNKGPQIINHFKLEFTFPKTVSSIRHVIQHKENIELTTDESNDYLIVYRSNQILFPKDKVDVNKDIAWCYQIDNKTYRDLRHEEQTRRNVSVNWIFFADNMPFKEGKVDFAKLHNY